jgi:hypothetical protein
MVSNSNLNRRVQTLERDNAPELFAAELRKVEDGYAVYLYVVLIDAGVFLPIDEATRQWANTRADEERREDEAAPEDEAEFTEAQTYATVVCQFWEIYNGAPCEFRAPGARHKVLEFLSTWVEPARDPDAPALPLEELPPRLDRCLQLLQQWEEGQPRQPVMDKVMEILK